MMLILTLIPIVFVITKWCYDSMVECVIQDFKTTMGIIDDHTK